MAKHGLTISKLKDLLAFADKNNTWYEVYSANTDDNGSGLFWEWIPLTEGVIVALQMNMILVKNFRTTGNQYIKLKAPRPKPVIIVNARKTNKKYNHTKGIDLYKL